MEFIKLATIIATSLFIIACGGKDDPKEIIFPEHLPQVNPNLNNDNPAGIWMVYRVHSTQVKGINENHNINGTITEVAYEITAIDYSQHDFYTLQFCTTTEFHESYDQGYEKLKNGYRVIFSGYENGPDTGSTGSLEVSFLNNQKIYGIGHKRTPYMHLGQEVVNEERIELFAVKISDEVDFNLSDDLIYTSTIEFESGDSNDTDPICIGLYDREIKILTDDAITYENYDKHVMLAERNASGFDLYSADGGDFGVIDQKLVGGWYYRNSIESQCDINDEECLNRYKLELNTLQNDKTGIAFSARLDIEDGDYFSAQISAILNPNNSAQINQ